MPASAWGDGSRHGRSRILGGAAIAVSSALAVASVLLVALEAFSVEFLSSTDRLRASYAATVLVVVALPFVLSWVLASVVRPGGDRYELVPPGPPHPEDEAVSARWDRVIEAVKGSWAYERARYEASLERIRPAAILFGLVATLLLAASFLFLCWRTEHGYGVEWGTALALAVSVAVTAAAGFAINSARLLVRIASLDYNSRMFTCATRSVVLAVIADVGLFAVLREVAGTLTGAILLGLFAAALGDHAIDLMVEKISAVFGVKVPKKGDSPLLAIGGVTLEDVERFEDEGVLSLHDLAFTPTARLFFNTTHSLQRIVDWQDQALLHVYFGAERARRIWESLTIRGVIDVQGLCEKIQTDEARSAKQPADSGEPKGETNLLEEVKAALQVGSVEAAREALATIEWDEPTMRLRIHFRSCVVSSEGELEGLDVSTFPAEVQAAAVRLAMLGATEAAQHH